METISGGINRKESLPAEIENSATIEAGIENSGLSTFGITGETFETPEEINDFYVTIIDDTGYIETRQK